MSRYFFHARIRDGLVEDPEGVECPDRSGVRAEAVEAARQIMAEHIRKGWDVSDWSFEVADEQGRPVMTVPFAACIDRKG